MKRAISVTQFKNTRFRELAFEGRWRDSFGQPELTGAWLIWGMSGNGKTRFSLQLAKYLTEFGRVAFNSLEEGMSKALYKAIDETGIEDVSGKIVFLDKLPVNEMTQFLHKRRSADIVIIDSLQYTGMNYKDYIKFKDTFRNKLFIFVSHADGREPAGRVARSIRFDVSVKIRIEGFRAYPVSRFGGGEPFIIWEEGLIKIISDGNNKII